MDIISLVLAILAAESCVGSENSKLVYIKPSSNTICNVKLCLTLSQLDGQISHPISNVTLILLPGTHNLFFNFSVANLTELLVYPNSSSELMIVCQKNASFEFKNISYFLIKRLKFIGCGRNKIQMVHKFYLKESTFVGKKTSGPALEFLQTTGFITNNSFISNKFGKFCGPVGIISQDNTHENASVLLNRDHAYVGGAIIANQSNLTITKSNFEGNSAEIGGAIFAAVNSNITIISSTFKNNYVTNVTERADLSYYGGALYIEGSTRNSSYISDENSQLVVLESEFRNNTASVGGVLLTYGCKVNITSSIFVNNSARESGVIEAKGGRIIVLYNSTFYKNVAYLHYGVIYSFRISTLTVNSCYFINNAAGWNGGAIGITESSVVIVNSTFFSNRARNLGSVIYTHRMTIIFAIFWHDEVSDESISAKPVLSHVNIHNTYISKNQGRSVLYILSTNLTTYRSVFDGNYASDSRGGILSIVESSEVNITESKFSFNSAVNGIILMNANSLNIHRSIFRNNTASENGGVLKVLRTSAHISQSEFVGNSAPIRGGVLWSVESKIFLKGTYMIGNAARYGGAIYAHDSKLIVYGGFYRSDVLPYGIRTNIADNTAYDSGGGIYLYRSDIECYFSTWLTIAGNMAKKSGGGIHAVSSFIKVLSDKSSMVKSSVHFTKNAAEMGGGIYLQSASKLHIRKSMTSVVSIDAINATIKKINFTANIADNGGAIYIDDETYFRLCTNSANHDCFVQVTTSIGTNNLKNILFKDNIAHKTGSDIFGGLLDRCNVNEYAEIRLITNNVFNTNWIDGVTYLKEISNMNITKIASKPVRLCSCKSNSPDCTYQPESIYVRKGENFSVSLVAVDQVNHTIDNVDIFSSLDNKESGLGVGQTIQVTKNGCTNLNFNAYSPFESEELSLYAEGPCKNNGISKLNLHITFLNCTCPIGFQQRFTEANNNCECECDSNLSPYITSCNYSTKSLLRDGSFWITYINDTRSDDLANYSYLIYPYCPLDYCLDSNQIFL